MSDLDDLYQEVILDHNKNPRNFREQKPPALSKEGYNPLCGDRIVVFVTLNGTRIADVSFQGSGCAISQASASVMTQILKGKTLEEAGALFDKFQGVVTGKIEADDDLGELAALAGVRTFPTRVKCATLAWHAFRSAVEEGSPVPSAEES